MTCVCLECYLTFTDRFCSQWNPDGDSSVPIYAIVVHSAADSKEALPPGGKLADAESVNSEGWVVTRRFKDFETLHVKLKEVPMIYQCH